MAHRYFDRTRPEREMAILERLVAIRRGRGLKVATVGRRMGCTQGAVSMFETSAKRGHSVTLDRLLRYADAIGAEIHVIPTGEAETA